jgi:hypothetical protein
MPHENAFAGFFRSMPAGARIRDLNDALVHLTRAYDLLGELPADRTRSAGLARARNSVLFAHSRVSVVVQLLEEDVNRGYVTR